VSIVGKIYSRFTASADRGGCADRRLCEWVASFLVVGIEAMTADCRKGRAPSWIRVTRADCRPASKPAANPRRLDARPQQSITFQGISLRPIIICRDDKDCAGSNYSCA